MLFGLDGVEIGLIIVFLCLFGGILSGFPVAFAIGGAAVISFGIIAVLDSAGILVHQAVDTGSDAYRALTGSGVSPNDISKFRFPELPLYSEPLFPGGWELALDRFGSRGLDTLLARAIHYARDGFPVSEQIARQWAGSAGKLSVHSDSKRVWLPGGKAPAA
ncbi:hypothetical protein LCGC14_2257990, partial [marine sediment metagenome]